MDNQEPLFEDDKKAKKYALKRFRSFVKRHDWTWAKTYADKAPHWYVNAKKMQGAEKEEFYEMVQLIRDYGVKEKFWNSTYTYLYLDGYKYWTMGWPVRETFILNRAEAKNDSSNNKSS